MRRIIYLFLIIFTMSWAQLATENNDYAYGTKLYEQGFYKLAAQQFQNFVNNYSSSSLAPEARFYVGLSYFQLKKYVKAKDAFQAMAVSYPEASKALEAWYHVGICEEKQGNYVNAAKAYANIRLLAPEDPLAAKSLFRAAENQFKAGNYLDAENSSRGIMDRYQESKEYLPAHILMGRIYSVRGRYSEAQKWFEKVISATGTENEDLRVSAQQNLAEVLIEQGRYNSALNTFARIEKFTSKTKFKSIGILGQIETLLLMGQMEKVKAIIERGGKIEFEGIQKEKYSQLKVAYFLLSNDFSSAFKEGQSLLGSSNVKSLAYYSVVLIDLKKYKSLIKLWEENQSIIAEDEQFGLLFSLNVLKAAFQGNSNQVTDVIAYVQTNFGRSANLANTMAGELIIAYNSKQYDLISQWGGNFIRNYPNHPDADIIAWWVAQLTEDPVLRREKLHLVIERFPVGDFIADMDHLIYADTQSEKLGYLLSKMLDIQVKQIMAEDPKQLLPEIAEIYWESGKTEQADRLLGKIDISTLEEQNKIRANYLLGEITFDKFTKDPEDLALLSKSQNYFKLVVSNKSHNIYLEPASEKLVEVSLILISKSFDKPGKTYKFYNALVNSFPNSKRKSVWLMRMAESQIPLVINKNDQAFKNVINSLTQIISDSDLMKDELFWQAKYFYGISLAKVGFEKQALDNLKEVIEKAPESQWQMKSLISAYPILAKSDPDMAGIWLYQLLENYSYANIVWEELDRIDISYWPDNSEKYLENRFSPMTVLDPLFKDQNDVNLKLATYLGRYYLAKGEYLKALKNLSYVYTQNPKVHKDQNFLKNLAKASEEAKQYDAAVWYWTRVEKISTGKNKTFAIFKQASITYKLGNYDNAAALAEKSRFKDLDASSRNDFLLLGYDSYLKTRKKTLADKFFAKHKAYFNKSNSLSAGVQISLGNYYLAENEYNKAMKSYKNSEKKGKSTEYYDDAIFKQTIVKVRLNRVKEAFEDFSDFLDDFPNSNRRAEVYMTLAQLYYRTEKLDEALNAYKNALAESPDDKIWRMAASNLIKLSYDMGLNNSALSLSQEYIARVPDAIDLNNKKIIIGRCYARMGQIDLAVRYLKKLKLEVDSESEPEIQFAIGEIFFTEGKYEIAIVEFLKIPVMSRKTKLQWEASAFYYAGQSYEKLGRIDDAVRMYQEIVNRPGIMADLKNAARERIRKIKS